MEARVSARLAGDQRIAKDFEPSRVPLASCAGKGVDLWADSYVDEAPVLDHLLPGCTRQTTAIGHHDIGPAVLDRQRFQDALAEFDIAEAHRLRGAAGRLDVASVMSTPTTRPLAPTVPAAMNQSKPA